MIAATAPGRYQGGSPQTRTGAALVSGALVAGITLAMILSLTRGINPAQIARNQLVALDLPLPKPPPDPEPPPQASSASAAKDAAGARNLKNKATPVILVCQAGVRSGRALNVARKLGYENVQSLAGGLKAWQAASMPVSKA